MATYNDPFHVFSGKKRVGQEQTQSKRRINKSGTQAGERTRPSEPGGSSDEGGFCASFYKQPDLKGMIPIEHQG
jgi:hypothetical protein